MSVVSVENTDENLYAVPLVFEIAVPRCFAYDSL